MCDTCRGVFVAVSEGHPVREGQAGRRGGVPPRGHPRDGVHRAARRGGVGGHLSRGSCRRITGTAWITGTARYVLDPTEAPTVTRSATSGPDRMGLKSGIILTVGDPRTVAELAALAEATGWDGAFTWDGIAIGETETYDPWVTMAAMAMTTERVRLGAIVTPPARRRPWKFARETMTLDRLSNGRLVLPVGLGALDDGAFGNVGEPTEARIRAERLDETLAILEGLWTGRPFAFEGRHYRFEAMTFLPTPVQQPRIPIWVIGAWPKERSVRRALRFDGIHPQTNDAAATARSRRSSTPSGRAAGGVDIIVEGTTRRRRGRDPGPAGGQGGGDLVDRVGLDDRVGRDARARIEAGPPVA